MRVSYVLLTGIVLLGACGSNGGNGDGGADDDGGGPCEGLECFQVECPTAGETTSVSGIVYAPNGTLPLSGISVYVPLTTVEPFVEGAQCDRCGSSLSGNPLVETLTDTFGRFTLEDMPATSSVPLVIQVGKWRRQIVLPDVPQCVDTPVGAAETRLPKNKSEGDIPRMALATGGADALECLLRKIGLDDAEFTTEGGTGRVHLFAGNASTSGGGVDQFDAALGGASFAQATGLWDDVASLSVYDVVILSCEGDQNIGEKPDTALAALKAYADLGGRVFMSHWHNYWLQATDPWNQTVTVNTSLGTLDNITADVNTGFDRGGDLADWLVNVGASTTLGKIDLTEAKHTVVDLDESMADKWIYLDTNVNGVPSYQYLSFLTPLEAPGDQRCGRAVFSDIHVSSGDESEASLTFPSGVCTTDVATLTPQEKVLAFMIFDIASCVGPIID